MVSCSAIMVVIHSIGIAINSIVFFAYFWQQSIPLFLSSVVLVNSVNNNITVPETAKTSSI